MVRLVVCRLDPVPHPVEVWLAVWLSGCLAVCLAGCLSVCVYVCDSQPAAWLLTLLHAPMPFLPQYGRNGAGDRT